MRSGSVCELAMAESHPWQIRARAAGLSQRLLARILGHTEANASAQLRGHLQSGVPQHVKAAILAWEMMSPEQRTSWLAKLDAEAAAASRGTTKRETPDVTLAEFRALQKQVRDLNKALAKATGKE